MTESFGKVIKFDHSLDKLGEFWLGFETNVGYASVQSLKSSTIPEKSHFSQLAPPFFFVLVDHQRVSPAVNLYVLSKLLLSMKNLHLEIKPRERSWEFHARS